MAVCALASLSCSFSGSAIAAMTLEQMNSLIGASQLEITVDQLIQNCGLPAVIMDDGSADGAKQSINWRGVAMRLSAKDWDALYGKVNSKSEFGGGWVNQDQSSMRCSKGLNRLLFHTKAHVGFLTIIKKAKGLGYITSYNVPKDQFKSHKVVSAEATLAMSLPVSALLGLYGQPDQLLKRAGASDKFRYWVVTHRGNMPELLYAVDFVIDTGICKTYIISTSDVDFVREHLDSLLRQWEKEYILD